MSKGIVFAFCVGLGLLVNSGCYAVNKEVKKGKDVAVESKKVEKVSTMKGDELMVADFNSGVKPNNLGGDFGIWNKDPMDDTQGCKSEYVLPGHEGKGQCLKLIYDVDSPNPAYNGFWMKLDGLDVSKYSKLTFWLKGDKEAGYPDKFKVELKDQGNTNPYYVSNVKDSWEKVEIALSDMKRIKDWTKMSEFVIVFEDNKSEPKAGAIYVDDIAFEK